MSKRISATEAARTFSDLINRVHYRGEEFIIERGGQPVCKIGPVGPTRCTVEELSRVMAELPPLDDDYVRTVRELTRKQPKAPKKSPWD